MPITFSCYCGESFTVEDRFAGKRTQCPSCRALLTVPRGPDPGRPAPPASPAAPAAAGYDDFELVEDDPTPAGGGPEDEIVLEVVEPAPAEAKKTAPVKAVKAPPDPPPARAKKKKRRKSSGDEGGLAAMYMEEARAQEERDAARSGGRREKGDGLTMFGVHVTAGVLGGAGLLLGGLLATLVILVFREHLGLQSWRLFYGAIAGTVLGGITLFRALVLGEED